MIHQKLKIIGIKRKINMKLFLSLLIIFNLSFARATECSKSVSYLNKSDQAPCSGYLFSPEKEQEVRIKSESFDLMKQSNDLYKSEIDVLNQRLKLTQEHAQSLETFFYDRKDKEWYVNMAFFFGGVLVTAFIASNVNK